MKSDTDTSTEQEQLVLEKGEMYNPDLPSTNTTGCGLVKSLHICPSTYSGISLKFKVGRWFA